MKRTNCFLLLLFPVCLLSGPICIGQPKVTWGKRFEMHKSSSDLTVTHVDETGIYLEEADRIMNSELFSPGKGNPFLLMKLNDAMEEVYRNDYGKELKGKSMAGFYFIQGKLYLFASNFDYKAKNAYLYAIELDKRTGKPKGDWQDVYEWYTLDKPTDVLFRVSYNGDRSGLIVSSTFTFSDQTSSSVAIKVMDASLRTIDSTFTISNEFDPKTYLLEEIISLGSDRFATVARVYDYEEGKKKKARNLDFKNYNIRIYDHTGKMMKDIRTDIDGNYLVSGKLMLLHNELLLAAFYSSDKAKSVINGMMVQRIDAGTGEVISTNIKALSSDMISDVESDDQKPVKDSTAEEEGLATNLVFRQSFASPDGGLVILAEQYKKETITGFGVAARSYDEFTCGNLYMCKMSAKGDIEWLNVLPKKQMEDMTLKTRGFGIGINGFFIGVSGWFDGVNARPYYAGFGCLAKENKINIFFNDNEKNASVLQEGTKIKKAKDNYDNTDCFVLTLDMTTGKLSRDLFFKNADIPPPMLRLGTVVGGTLYVVGRTDNYLGAPDVAVGRITITP